MISALLGPALHKEVRAALPLWAVAATALVAASFWSPGLVRHLSMMVYIVGASAIGAHAVGQEYSHGTLAMLLAQPIDRRRLYLLKWAVAALMVATLGLLAAVVMPLSGQSADSEQALMLMLPAVSAMTLAPLFTMVCRSALAGVLIGWSAIAMVWIAILTSAWFLLGLGPSVILQVLLVRWEALLAIAAPLVFAAGWWRFTSLETTDVGGLTLRLPGWMQRANSLRRYAPVPALALKELHLQQLPIALSAVYMAIWLSFLLLRPWLPSVANFPAGAILLMYSMGLALAIGATASADERQLGVLDTQWLQPVSRVTAWLVKVGVTITVALALGLVLPVTLTALATVEGGNMIRLKGDLAAFLVLMTAASLYLSTLSPSGVRAMALLLPVVVAVSTLFQVTLGAISAVGAPPLTPDVILHIIRILSAVSTPLLLWFGFANHNASDWSIRRVMGQTAALAAAVVAAVVAAVLTN